MPSLRPIRLSLGGGSGLGGGGPGDACLEGRAGGSRLGLLGDDVLIELLLPPKLNFRIEVNRFFPKFEDSSPFRLSIGSLVNCSGLDCAGE